MTLGRELRREALSYSSKRTVDVADWMVRLGVERDLTGRLALGVSRAEIVGRFWEPSSEGEPVLTCPIWVGNDCIDIVALDPKDESRWWARTDIASVIDSEQIARAVHFDEPLDIHASPLAWLRAGARGTAILDWRSVSFWLAGVRRFLCFDDVTAERLDRGLRNPPPQFQIKLVKERINDAA